MGLSMTRQTDTRRPHDTVNSSTASTGWRATRQHTRAVAAAPHW